MLSASTLLGAEYITMQLFLTRRIRSTMGDEVAIVVDNLPGTTEYVARRAGVEAILNSGAGVVHGEVGFQQPAELDALRFGVLVA